MFNVRIPRGRVEAMPGGELRYTTSGGIIRIGFYFEGVLVSPTLEVSPAAGRGRWRSGEHYWEEYSNGAVEVFSPWHDDPPRRCKLETWFRRHLTWLRNFARTHQAKELAAQRAAQRGLSRQVAALKDWLARPEVETVLEARWAPPASRRAVAAAAKRLGVTLPPAFRGWLGIHGGLTIGFRDAAKARRMYAELFGADALRREKRTIHDTLGMVPADLIIFGQVRDEEAGANSSAALNLLMERRGGECAYGLLQRHKKQRFFSPRLESFAAWLAHLRELLEKCLVVRATAGGSPQKSRA